MLGQRRGGGAVQVDDVARALALGLQTLGQALALELAAVEYYTSQEAWGGRPHPTVFGVPLSHTLRTETSNSSAAIVFVVAIILMVVTGALVFLQHKVLSGRSYTTVAGTATVGDDFLAPSGTVTSGRDRNRPTNSGSFQLERHWAVTRFISSRARISRSRSLLAITSASSSTRQKPSRGTHQE